MSFQLGRAWAKLTFEINMPDMAGDLFVTIKGHYTGYPSGGVPQTDKDFEIIVERFPLVYDGFGCWPSPLHSVRKIVSRLIAYYLSGDL